MPDDLNDLRAKRERLRECLARLGKLNLEDHEANAEADREIESAIVAVTPDARRDIRRIVQLHAISTSSASNELKNTQFNAALVCVDPWLKKLIAHVDDLIANVDPDRSPAIGMLAEAIAQVRRFEADPMAMMRSRERVKMVEKLVRDATTYFPETSQHREYKGFQLVSGVVGLGAPATQPKRTRYFQRHFKARREELEELREDAKRHAVRKPAMLERLELTPSASAPSAGPPVVATPSPKEEKPRGQRFAELAIWPLVVTIVGGIALLMLDKSGKLDRWLEDAGWKEPTRIVAPDEPRKSKQPPAVEKPTSETPGPPPTTEPPAPPPPTIPHEPSPQTRKEEAAAKDKQLPRAPKDKPADQSAVEPSARVQPRADADRAQAQQPAEDAERAPEPTEAKPEAEPEPPPPPKPRPLINWPPPGLGETSEKHFQPVIRPGGPDASPDRYPHLRAKKQSELSAVEFGLVLDNPILSDLKPCRALNKDDLVIGVGEGIFEITYYSDEPDAPRLLIHSVAILEGVSLQESCKRRRFADPRSARHVIPNGKTQADVAPRRVLCLTEETDRSKLNVSCRPL